jgi:hypothetical protein
VSRDTAIVLRKLGPAVPADAKQPLSKSPSDLGQSYPWQYPQAETPNRSDVTDTLGEPLSIHEAARIIGCSPWTIRQKYLPAGLPYHRLAPRGKLLFYRKQITRWLIRRQKGGMVL